MVRPTISVVVPAYNEERLLARTLAAIRGSLTVFAERGWSTEVIVCDNNSNDRTSEIARNEGAHVVFEPKNQISRARNTGAAAAQGEWLIFVDADSEPTPELIAAVAREIETGTCLAGGSTLRMHVDSVPVRWVILLWNSVSRAFKCMAGSFIFCETSAFRQIGGFDEHLFASEELDLTRRLKQVARQRRKRIVILTQHPLLTSSRKAHLYTSGEYLWFMARTVLTLGRSIRCREGCSIWYDGRR